MSDPVHSFVVFIPKISLTSKTDHIRNKAVTSLACSRVLQRSCCTGISYTPGFFMSGTLDGVIPSIVAIRYKP